MYEAEGTTLKAVLLVSAGGVLGSLSRFFLDQFFISDRIAVIAANIIGSALAAHILVLMERRGLTWARYFLLPGFCGGMTTFSSVAFQSMSETHENLIFIAANVIFSFAAIAITLPLSRKWIKAKV